MPEPESLPSDELVDVLEHALAPMTAEQLRDELLDAGMDVTMRQVRLALTLLADERRVRETQNGRWALRARAPAPRAAAPPEVAPLPGVRPRVGPATARAAARVQVTSGASGRTIIRAPNVAARQPAPPPPAPPPPAAPNPAAPPRPVGASQDEIWAALARTVASGLRPLPHGASLPLILAAHEWSLATPLNINRREDLLSLPVIKVEPFEHQVRSIVAFFRRLSPRGLIADDVGLGKTITAGLILAELIKRRRAQTFLVVAPKLILEQWRAELKEKFNIEAIACVGAALPEALRRGRVITTYQTVSRYYEDVKAAAPDVLILDEIHKIRNLYSPNPPLMAQRVHQLQREGVSRWVIGLSATPLQNRLVDLYSIADVLRAPNPNPYGSITRFAQTYLEDGQYGRRLRPQAAAEFRRRTSEYMHRTRRQDSGMSFPGRIVHIDAVPVSEAERHALDEALKALVAAGANPLERINLAQSILSSPAAARAAVRKQIDKGRDGFRSVLPLFEALTHTGKLGRLLALVRELRAKDTVGWRILVFTLRKATADAIRAALHAEGLGEEVVEVRGDQGAQNQAAVERFTASPPQARVLVSTDAGAEGVNLQACNVLVNFDLPWNPMLLEQRVGRVQRLGQQARSVIIYNLVTKGTVEEQVVSRLYEKLRLYDAAIGMAEEILGQLGDEADSDDFAKRVLRLVEAAVQRRDVDEMQREMEESARKARDELARQSAEIERVLGAVDMPEPVAMPAITPTRPSMDLRTFWQAAMRASGWNLEARDGGATLEATQRGRAPRRFTFDPSHRFRQVQIIGAHAVELVASDERALDEMVRAWSLDGLDATTVRPAPPLADTEHQLAAALAPRVRRVIFRPPGGLSHRGDVTILARVNTSVFHDQYEKILRVTQPVELSADGDPRTAAMGARLGPAMVRALRSAIEQDEDIQNFSGFYLSRRATEKAQVLRALGESQQATPELQRRLIAEIDDRLTPLHEARLIAVSGELHARQLLQLEVELDTGRVVRVEVDLDGQADVTQHLSTLAERRGGGVPSVCDAGHLTGSAALVSCSAPGCGLQRCGSCREWTACATCQGGLCAAHTLRCSGCAGTVCDAHVVHLSSGALACAGCSGTCAASDRVVLARELVLCQKTGLKALPSEMARCAVSKLLVLRRELVACEVSGELALPERLVASAGSGKRVLPRLLQPCAVTGKLALAEELVLSEVSTRWALPDELVSCEETGKRVLPDELGHCAISGRRALLSLMVTASRSGRRALKRYAKHCAVCAKVALADELSLCAVTDRGAEPVCMRRSDLSNRLALPSVLVTCQLTQRRVLPSETEVCTATGRVVALDRMVACAFSGERVADDQVETSAVTDRVGWRARMARSQVSGRWAGRDELVRTGAGASVLPTEAHLCPCCGRAALILPPYNSEARGCPCCDMAVCAADLGADGRCWLCVRALTEPQPEGDLSAFAAVFPKARRWNVATGHRYRVGVGLPAWFAVLTSARLVVIGAAGEVLSERELSKSDIGPRVRAMDGG